MTAGFMLAGAVTLLALPSAVLAFSTGFEPDDRPETTSSDIDGFARAEEAPLRLARAIPMRSLGHEQPFPFTPAKTPVRPDRSVTVAIRVDPETARSIQVRGPKPKIADNGASPLRIAPTAFSLGVSRGYHNFAQDLVPPADKPRGELPDLGNFSIAPGAKPDDSRFSPRIVIDEKQAAGRAPRTFAGDREDQVDVGGSYRVTRNLDVTAGVRYSQDQRERLLPLTDGKQDGQAVYVGTQFRF
ncbi:MAG: hypothetical protein KDE55_14660 [Novosphingobium sp.]|nr:hypothetical protein [Novosphingobium sp.]